jgi:hypothetical protein
VPEFHVVKKGDTLWSVCDGYFRDPWRWPRLWAQNPLITNPHWIFPGDVIRMHEPGAPAPAAPVASGPGAPLITSTRQGSLTSNALVLREIGFVEAKDLAVSAVISGSREEKIMLSTNDQPTSRSPRSAPCAPASATPCSWPIPSTRAGARQQRDPRVPGAHLRRRGGGSDRRPEVGPWHPGRPHGPGRARLQISPVVRQFRRVEPRPSGVNLEVRIVAAFSSARMLSAETFVVLSRGRKDGVEIGNRSFVVRRGDGYRRIMEGWDHFDPNYPNEVVGSSGWSTSGRTRPRLDRPQHQGDPGRRAGRDAQGALAGRREATPLWQLFDFPDLSSGPLDLLLVRRYLLPF